MMRLIVSALVLFAFACEEPVTPPPPVGDSSVDAPLPPRDSEADADGMDAGGIDAILVDGGPDAGSDAGPDASPLDAGPPPDSARADNLRSS